METKKNNRNYEIAKLTLVVRSLRAAPQPQWICHYSSSRRPSSEVQSSARDGGGREHWDVASMMVVSELVVALHEHDGHDGRLKQARDDE